MILPLLTVTATTSPHPASASNIHNHHRCCCPQPRPHPCDEAMALQSGGLDAAVSGALAAVDLPVRG